MSVSLSVGDKINRLTVIGESFMKNGRKYFPCACECGKTKSVREDALKSNDIVSCGCFRLEQLRKTIVTHKKTNTMSYSTWEGMIQKYNNPKTSNYFYSSMVSK